MPSHTESPPPMSRISTATRLIQCAPTLQVTCASAAVSGCMKHCSSRRACRLLAGSPQRSVMHHSTQILCSLCIRFAQVAIRAMGTHITQCELLQGEPADALPCLTCTTPSRSCRGCCCTASACPIMHASRALSISCAHAQHTAQPRHATNSSNQDAATDQCPPRDAWRHRAMVGIYQEGKG
jgi:hypothetical protein